MGALLGKVRRGQAGNMVDFLMALFDARPLWTHSVRSDPLTMTDAFGTMYAASTYEWLAQNLTETHVYSGLVNRILWFSAPPTPKARIAIRPAIPEEAAVEFRSAVVQAILAVRGGNMSLTPEAFAVHEQSYEKPAGVPPDHLQKAADARADQLALRLAMLLAVADATPVIGVDHVRAA